MQIVICTVAYNTPEFVEEGLKFFFDHSYKIEYDRHVLIDPGYPLPDEESNRIAMKLLAEKYNLEYHSIKNLGSHKNFNWALQNCCHNDDDIFVTVCPDTRCYDTGWVKAGCDVLRGDQTLFTVQLSQKTDYSKYHPILDTVGGYEILRFPELVAWPTGMFNVGHIKSIGGFDAYSEQYGYIEHYLHDKFKPLGKRWCLLKNFYDSLCSCPDELYQRWKLLSAQKQTSKDFTLWLKEIDDKRPSENPNAI